MYVCNCNGLTEREISRAIEELCRAIDAGETTASAVLARCGWQPGCGKCVNEVRAMLYEQRAKGDGREPATLRPAFA